MRESQSDGFGYAALCKECGGCIAWASADLPPASLSKSVARMLRSREVVLSGEEVELSRARKWGHAETCSQARPKKAPNVAQEALAL